MAEMRRRRNGDSTGKIAETANCSGRCGKNTIITCSRVCSSATNFCSRGSNWILQVYALIVATLIVASAQFSPVRAYDHLGSLHQLAHWHGHSQNFESFRAEIKAALEESQQQEPLAVKHNRLDPLHRFKKYKGGYNLQDKHYLASTLFTGIHGYFLGTFWLLGGMIGAISLYIRRRHFRKKALKAQPFSKPSMTSTHKSKMKLVPVIFATISTTLIVSCCGVACVGSQSFHTTAKKVERTIILEGANNATRLIYNVTQMLGQMKVDIEQYDEGVAQRLDNTTAKLNNASTALLNSVHDHKRNLDLALLGLNAGVIAIAIANISLWTFGLACLYLYLFLLFPKIRPVFLIIFALLWLLISLNWFTYGITYFISNFADDTCEALKEYQESSRNTTLDNVLPCHKLATGSKAIIRLRQKIYNYIEEANKNITRLNLKQRQEKRLTGESNDSATQYLPRVCNPFLGPPTYPTSNDCTQGTIPISSLPQILSFFKCSSNTSNKANSMRGITCISTRQYNATSAYISATQKLLRLLPNVENLTSCSFVVETFTIILEKQCRPLKNSIRMVWVAMVLLSTLSTFTMIVWLLQLWLLRKFKFSLVQ